MSIIRRMKLLSFAPLALAAVACSPSTENGDEVHNESNLTADAGSRAEERESPNPGICEKLVRNSGRGSGYNIDSIPNLDPFVGPHGSLKRAVQLTLEQDRVVPTGFELVTECSLTHASAVIDPRATTKFSGTACVIDGDFSGKKKKAIVFSVARPIFHTGSDGFYTIPDVDMAIGFRGVMMEDADGKLVQIFKSEGDSAQTVTFPSKTSMKIVSTHLRETSQFEENDWVADLKCNAL